MDAQVPLSYTGSTNGSLTRDPGNHILSSDDSKRMQAVQSDLFNLTLLTRPLPYVWKATEGVRHSPMLAELFLLGDEVGRY